MDNPRDNSRITFACLLLIILVTCAGFAYSVKMRSPWFGKSPACPETWLTSDTVLFCRQWFRDGPLALRFGLFHDPHSIEYPTLASREVYSSYPPGAIVPIYLISLIAGHEPSLAMLITYNLLNQYTTALLVALLLFYFLRRMACAAFDSTVLALTAVFPLLFLPAPAFHFQMSYFHDMSVLLPFVLYVFLELVRDHTESERWRKWISLFQAIIAFLGILSDWLFAFVVFCLYLKRFACGQIVAWQRQGVKQAVTSFFTRSVSFWISFACGLGLFALQLAYFGRFAAIAAKFEERTGLHHGSFMSLSKGNHFWKHHIIRGYGEIGRALVFLSLGMLCALLLFAALRVLFRRKPNAAMNGGLALIFLILAPCLLQVFFLKQHSSHMFHFFSTTKFALPIAMIPFVLLPFTLLRAFNLRFSTFSFARLKALVARRPSGEVKARWSFIPLVMFGLMGAYVHGELPRTMEQFEVFREGKYDPVVVGDFVIAHTGYEDVLFTLSGDFETSRQPAGVAYNMKRVYWGRSVKEVWEKMKEVDGEYTVDYLLSEEDLGSAKPGVLSLLAKAKACHRQGDMLLYQIAKPDFLEVCREKGLL